MISNIDFCRSPMGGRESRGKDLFSLFQNLSFAGSANWASRGRLYSESGLRKILEGQLARNRFGRTDFWRDS